MFLSDRKPKDILMDVVENQIVPGFKDNIRNSFVSSVDMFIYQGAKTVNQSSSSNHISYNSMYKAQQANKNLRTAPQPDAKANEPVDNGQSNGFSNPTFRYKSNPDPNNIGADQFLAAIKEREYPTFSVMDLYNMRGQSISWTWDVWGWTREELQNVKVVRIANTDKPWMIELPPAHLINN